MSRIGRLCLVVVALIAAPILATSTGSPLVGQAVDGTAFDWPQFHQNSTLTGYAANSSLSTSNAGQLGVTWASDLHGPALDSPVVAYDANLAKTLAYIGTEHGSVLALDAATGQVVWSVWLGAAIRATPLVSNGAVFAATFNSPRMYKLDATTGAVDCSVAAPQPIEGTPTTASPPGGVASVYFGTNDSQSAVGPMLAINAGTCAIEWQFTGYNQRAGSWTAAAYATDTTGEPLLVFGTSDPDTSVYAVDAVTGHEVWRFQAYNPAPGTYDIGAGIAISPPGTNGFADGIAYAPTKLGIMYALDLTTGTQVWSTNFDQIAGSTESGRSTAALDGTNLVFGYKGGLFDLDAGTGAVTWIYHDPSGTEMVSSPAIAGAAGQEILAAGDLNGGVDVVSLATGSALYHYQTAGYITASPAVSNGNLLIASSDGFLYNLAVGGGNNATLPAASITTPADSSSLANPNGDLQVMGTASDPTAVASVQVAVQSGGPTGPWWNASTGSWSTGPVNNPATLTNPNASSTSWAFSYPVPGSGATYTVTAYAVSGSGQSGVGPAQSSFAVLATTVGPRIKASPAYVVPGASATVTGAGFSPSETITFSLAGTTLGTTTTNSNGNILSTSVKIPSKSAFGQTTLLATGATSGKSASAAITIANNWHQLGYNADHTSYEPNDPILFDLVHPGGNIFVDLAWNYQSGAPFNSSPALANGVLYGANTAGQLIALDIHTGSPRWSWTIPSGSPIKGSPAVDTAKGLVFIGANDGTLDAVWTATGHLAWSTPIGGTVSAPVYASGQVYVASSSGTVESVAETSGTPAWSVNLSSSIGGAPSLDTANNTLVVGEGNGTVVALNNTRGSMLWTYQTGSSVQAAATISGGVVYVGSSDDNVYALSESTGARLWSYTTGGPVNDTGSLTNHVTPGGALELFIGSGDGYLYAIQASNGALSYKVAYHSPMVGVATVEGVAVIDTASGMIGSARTYSDLDVWNYQTSAGITSAPIVVDGTIYATAGDGNVYAFTSYGQPPV
jgi:outer membrane protein assembly factor BamB